MHVVDSARHDFVFPGLTTIAHSGRVVERTLRSEEHSTAPDTRSEPQRLEVGQGSRLDRVAGEPGPVRGWPVYPCQSGTGQAP